LHTLLDIRGSIPTFIWITDGKVHDVKVLDELLPEPGAFYVMDRAYLDFKRLHSLNQSMAYFIIRSKTNTDYPDKLRRVKFFHEKTAKRFSFLTNNFVTPPFVIAELYRCRWQVELFFKWIKQHLRIKAFYGTSENAVKTQVWIAVSVYVLVAIVKKRLRLKDMSLYTILQILSVTLFEKELLLQVLRSADYNNFTPYGPKQLKLFES